MNSIKHSCPNILNESIQKVIIQPQSCPNQSTTQFTSPQKVIIRKIYFPKNTTHIPFIKIEDDPLKIETNITSLETPKIKLEYPEQEFSVKLENPSDAVYTKTDTNEQNNGIDEYSLLSSNPAVKIEIPCDPDPDIWVEREARYRTCGNLIKSEWVARQCKEKKAAIRAAFAQSGMKVANETQEERVLRLNHLREVRLGLQANETKKDRNVKPKRLSKVQQLRSRLLNETQEERIARLIRLRERRQELRMSQTQSIENSNRNENKQH